MPKPPAPHPAPAPHWPFLAAIIVAVALPYLNSFSVPFVLDDTNNIIDNLWIRGDGFSFGDLRRAAVQDGRQLRPLSNLTFALDWRLHRLSPRIMHLENLALHLGNSALLYFLILAVMAAAGIRPRRPQLTAVVGALAWALHPAHAQAVSYLVQRQTVMAVLGIMLGLLGWLRFRMEGRRRWAAVAAAGLVVAAGSKEIGFVAPLLWLPAEILLLRRGRRALIAAGAALAGLGAVAVAGLAATGLWSANYARYRLLDYGPLDRVLTEARVLWSYLAVAVLPLPGSLSLFHYVAPSHGLFDPWTTAAAVAGVVAVAGLAVALRRRAPLFGFLAAGLLCALLPESTIIPIELRNDHRLYLYGLFVLPALAGATLAALGPRRALPLLAVILCCFSLITGARNRVWQSPERLWSDACRKAPELAQPWSRLSEIFLEEGRREQSVRLSLLGARLTADPKWAAVLAATGLIDAGRFAKAEAIAHRALLRYPDHPVLRYLLAAAQDSAGKTGEAAASYTRVLELQPGHRPALAGRAEALERLGRADDAARDYRQLTVLSPGSAEGWLGLLRLDRAAGGTQRVLLCGQARAATDAAEVRAACP